MNYLTQEKRSRLERIGNVPKSTKLYFHLQMAIFLLFKVTQQCITSNSQPLLWWFSRQQNIRYQVTRQLGVGKCYMMNGPRKVLMICSAWPRSVSYFYRKVFCIYLAIFLFKIRMIRFFVLRQFCGMKISFQFPNIKNALIFNLNNVSQFRCFIPFYQ